MTSIRAAEKADLPQVLALIQELADYEKAGHEVDNTVARMEIDGFGENPVFGCFVADNDQGEIVGIGKRLFDQVIEKGLETDCTGMIWQVLDWSAPAINFYDKFYQPRYEDEWRNCKLTRQQMRAALNPPSD